MKSIYFTVSHPIGKKNRMAYGRGRVYKKPEVEAFEFRVRMAVREIMVGDPWKGAVKAEIFYDHEQDELLVYLYESGPKTKRKRKDIQNLTDVLFDAIQGYVYEDDSQLESISIALKP